MEEAVTITAADDGGFIVTVRVKRKKKKDDKGEIHCETRMDEKRLLAKDTDEVKTLLDKILPDMKPGGMEEDDFAKAFKEAKEDES